MTAVCCLCAAVTFIFAICLQSSGAQNVSHSILNTSCGQDIVIPTGGGYDQIIVNLTFSQFMQSGATCSWEIPVQNISISNQVILTLPSSLPCDPSVFKVWEQDPANSVQNPLIVKCTGSLGYWPVISQPGFSLRILLNTSLPLPQSTVLFLIVPKVWTDDICPRNTPKVIVAPQGSEDDKETLDPTRTLISNLPDNMVCQWVIRSSDEGLVKLQVISAIDTSEMVCSDHFLLSDEESSSNPVSVPLCSRERIPFDYTSTTGSVYVTSRSGSSGISQRWYIYFWSVDACPLTPLGLEADKDKVDVLKGTSFSTLEAGQDKQCAWNITSHKSQVIKFMQLDAAEFQQDCNNNSTSDYLVLNGEKVGLCDSSKFPIWSETNFMEISFHTITQAARRSFLLRYTAMYKTPCQGHPERKTITGLRWIGQYVRLRPIPAGDEDTGHVCQWLYTARDDGKVIRVKVEWAAPGSENDDDGVNFNRDSCSYAHFHAYNGNSINSSTEITPTCTADKSTIIYLSVSREMLFVYSRDASQPESGFMMDVNQIADPTVSGGVGNWELFAAWRVLLPGLVALMIVVCQ